MADISKLEQQANLLMQNVSGWESRVLKRIGGRIGHYGKLSLADVKAINNIAVVKSDMDAITKELAKVTGYNISQIEQMYGELLEEQHLANEPLYDYRGKKFVPFAENRELQAIARAYAKTTGETMINLAKTKALCILDHNGKVKGLQRAYTDVLDKAVMQVTTGATDFHTAMRDSIIELGGSGVRVDYGGGVTRRLDTVVRQNLLWGAKQSSVAYNELIYDELGCSGYEVDWHSNPRPSHEFMQGKQFVVGKARTINGVHFDSFDEAEKRLQDYGCLHYKTPIICGVSEPRYSPEELKRLNEQNEKRYTIDGKEYSGYDITQMQRRLETSVRNEKTTRELAKASGDNALVKRCNERIKAYQGKYKEISEITGIQGDKKRMSIPRGKATVKGTTPNTEKVVDIPKKETPKVEAKPKQDILSFTPKQEETIEWYVSGEGQWINQALRGRGDIKMSDLTSGEKELLENLTKATERPLAEDVTKLYRSVDASAVFGDMSQTQFEQLQERLLYGEGTFGKGVYAEKIKAQTDSILSSTKGKTITEKGFMSTSKEYDVISEWGDFTGADKPINLELDIPKGIQGADLRKFDVEGEEQFEVLLARNTEYEITEITAKDGYIYVKAKVLRQK